MSSIFLHYQEGVVTQQLVADRLGSRAWKLLMRKVLSRQVTKLRRHEKRLSKGTEPGTFYRTQASKIKFCLTA
jgi:hypothetical protein